MKQLHQKFHFAFRALPIFGAKGVEREVRDTFVDAKLADLLHDLRARLVPAGAQQSALFRPAPVAVHHKSEMI